MPLLHNSRFYILMSSICLSMFIVAHMRLSIQNDQLFIIRTEQLLGVLAVAYWYVALLISPLSHILRSANWMRYVIFARRAIGVSAAYFALLHGGIALWGQLGGIGGIGLLPDRFAVALLLGATGAVILLIMAATSFDAVIAFMTPRRWKMLHRLGYAGGIVVLIHIWMIGTHANYLNLQVIALILIGILLALESIRTIKAIMKRFPSFQSTDIVIALSVCLWVCWMTLLCLLPVLIKSYHGENHKNHSHHSREQPHA